MLLIWDIHIHPRYSDLTIDMLRTYITNYDKETHIIFMWDYVYHFSYHKTSLLALLDFFLELTWKGKIVYILAWNHDWLWQHFVYAEAEKILKHNWNNTNIYFITKPSSYIIDNENIVFLPYIINRSEYELETPLENLPLDIEVCKDSKNGNIQSSYILNSYLFYMVNKERTDNKNKKITIIHHYYTANIKFPWIKTQFWYKDIALSPYRLDQENLYIISWHIHHSFSYKNYLCLWAIWSTSPLENNQIQYLFSYSKWSLIATQIAINPYINIKLEENEIVTNELIEETWQHIQKQSYENFISNSYPITYKNCKLPIERTILTIISNTIWYENLKEHIKPEIENNISEIKIKQNLWAIDTIIEDLIDINQDFSSSWSDWKILLDTYIERKFWEKKQIYIDTLKELKIYQ